MEICRMDKSSHFHKGSSHKMLAANYDYNDNSGEPSQFIYDRDLLSNISHNVASEQQGYHQKLDSANTWKSESVDCKQEIDPSTSFMNNPILSENVNYGSEGDFREPYHYAYNQISPQCSNDANSTTTSLDFYKNNVQQPRLGPYQISSTKNQLPTWYTPPSTYYAQQPNIFQHQYPYHPRNFTSAQQPPPVEQNMRNMIQLTSRYFLIAISFIEKKKKTFNDESILSKNKRCVSSIFAKFIKYYPPKRRETFFSV